MVVMWAWLFYLNAKRAWQIHAMCAVILCHAHGNSVRSHVYIHSQGGERNQERELGTFLDSKFNSGRGIRTIGNLITCEIEPTNFPTQQTAAFGLVVRVMARCHISISEGREFESCFCN